MSIEDYSERVLTRLDKAFEANANALLLAAKTFDHNRAGFLAGKMEGLTAAHSEIREVRKLYLNDDHGEASQEDERKSLY